MTRLPLIALAAMAALGLAATPALAQYHLHLHRVAPSQLSHYWVRTNKYVNVTAPNTGHGLKAVGCAAVSYMIGSNGETSHVKVRKVVPSTSDFKLMASSFVKALHYAPASENKADQPVMTYFIVPFNIPTGDKATLERVLKSCHLPGYGS